MKKEFIVERNGRNFVLYAGLLDEAHGMGLEALSTALIQAPSDDNGRVAIVQATAVIRPNHDKDALPRSFSGLGDASPENVARPMVTCLIRMAETRAKARALRDAVNVGAVALDELDDADEPDGTAPSHHVGGTTHMDGPREERREPTPLRQQQVSPAERDPNWGRDQQATTAQVRAIYAMARNIDGRSEADTDDAVALDYNGRTPSQLTKREASELIDRLKKMELDVKANGPAHASPPKESRAAEPPKQTPAEPQWAPPIVTATAVDYNAFWAEVKRAGLGTDPVKAILGEVATKAKPVDLAALVNGLRAEANVVKGLPAAGLTIGDVETYRREHNLKTLAQAVDAILNFAPGEK